MKLKGKICLFVAILMVVMVGVLIVPTVADGEGAEIHGDKSRFYIEKNVFYVGEPIMVTAKGSGRDWVACIPESYTASANYFYVDKSAPKGVGSGVPFDVLKAPFRNTGKPLLPGTYRLALLPNDMHVSGGVPIAYADILIVQKDTVDPKVVNSATYVLDNDTDGYATGKVTVNVDEDQVNGTHIVMYWGNENGKLPGYASLSKFKVTGTTTVADISNGVIIPNGATKLLIYATSNSGLKVTEECYTIDLPKGSACRKYTDPIFSCTVVSDVHITLDNNHTHNKHFKNMLEDVTKLIPDSIGTFIVGDVADQGDPDEFKNMDSIYKSVKGAAPLYMSVGDHDMRGGIALPRKAQLFNKYITLPDNTHPKKLHYDFWSKGYHFIFLGTDEIHDESTSTLHKDTLKWLDETLAENYDPKRPTFIFLHQPLPNTVIGSLRTKYGQYWGQVATVCEKEYRNILAKYPEAILFNGHTHGLFNSECNIYMDSDELPTIVNTGAVAYEWDTYLDKKEGQNVRGSEGYIMEVYPEKVVLKGRDFVTGEWVPNAQYLIRYAEDPEHLPEETETETAVDSSDESKVDSAVTETNKDENGRNFNLLDALLIAGGVLVVAGAVTAGVIALKKHNKNK